MTWKLPPRIKIFEALGSIADDRIKIEGTTAKVSSSDGSKAYSVKFDLENNKITSNDNASKWQGYTGYPIIAVLMKLGKLSFDESLSQELKGIEWKKINSQFKNDWSKTEEFIFEGKDQSKFENFAEKIMREIEALALNRF